MRPATLIPIAKVLIQARKPFLIKGRPGVGKTEIIRQIAIDLNYDFITWHPAVSDPTDFKGFPFPSKNSSGKTIADFIPYGDLEHVITTKRKTIVLIDDLGHGTPAVQAAVMHPLLAREINGRKISDTVTFVAATNRREDRAGVQGLITPLLDRMVAVYELDASATDWVKWGLTAGVPPVLLAFINLVPKYIESYTPSKDMVKTTSPRTLYEVGEMLKLGLDSLDALAGAAGEGFATEFLGFYRTFEDMPDPTDVIMNPTTAKVPGDDRPDVLLALMGSLARHASRSNFSSIVTYLERVAPEYAVCCIKAGTQRDPGLLKTGAYITFITKHQELFGMAGAA